MTIEVLQNRLQKVIAGLEDEAKRVTIAMAQTSLSIVKNRSIQDGIFIDGKEGNTKQYSNNPIPTFFFTGKERNAKGKKLIKDKKLASYKEFRQVQGLLNDNINLSYTNRHWASMAIQQTGIINGSVYAKVGTVDTEVLRYAGYLRAKYGNYLMPTDLERQELIKDAGIELTRYIIKTLKNG